MINFKIEIDGYNKYYNKNIDSNKFISVLELFSKQGHSGFSANYCLSYVKSLYDNYEYTYKTLMELENNAANDSEDDKNNLEMQKLITKNILDIYNATSDFTNEEKNIFINLASFKPLYPLLGTEDEWRDITNEYNDSSKINYKEYQNKRCSAIFKYVFSDGMSLAYYLDENIYSDDGGINFFTTGRFPREEISFPYVPKTNKNYIYENGKLVFKLTNIDSINKLKKIYCESRYKRQC